MLVSLTPYKSIIPLISKPKDCQDFVLSYLLDRKRTQGGEKEGKQSQRIGLRLEEVYNETHQEVNWEQDLYLQDSIVSVTYKWA
jgi:hypothetical protein